MSLTWRERQRLAMLRGRERSLYRQINGKHSRHFPGAIVERSRVLRELSALEARL